MNFHLRKGTFGGNLFAPSGHINNIDELLPKPIADTEGDAVKKKFILVKSTSLMTTAGGILLGWMLAAGTATFVQAQGQIASGAISSSGVGTYSYSLSFSDAPNSTSPIGSVWYAWIPGAFYLPGPPTQASVPAGWTANISGHSIQFVANSPANDILPGQSLSGFGYQANFTPTQLAAAPHSGDSVAYSGGLFSDVGSYFTVVQTVPEPSALMLLIFGTTGLWLVGQRKLRAA
jgi:hypothetical protein